MDKRVNIWRVVMWPLLVCAIAPTCFSQDDEDDLPPYLPGMVAVYTGSGGESCRRIDSSLAFGWGRQSPDPRISAGDFNARWTGRLFTITPGKYRLHLFTAGEVQIRLAGKEVLNASANQPGWLSTEVLDMPFGRHQIEILFRKKNDQACLTVYWDGPGFRREPIQGRWLIHDREPAVSDEFQQGQQLVRSLRCGACHSMPEQRQLIPAPALDRLAGNLSRTWMISHLTSQHKLPSLRRMPHFSISRADAEAMADYLFASSPRPKLSQPKAKRVDDKTAKKQTALGDRLVHTLGCLACHQVGKLGHRGLFGGGDLSDIANKRPQDYFARWLAEPEKINHDHRMPIFSLSKQERSAVAAYLGQLKRPAKAGSDSASDEGGENATGDDEAQRIRGRKLLSTYRCNVCHRISDLPKDAAARLKPISREADWQLACTSAPEVQGSRPGYRLSASAVAAVRKYLATVSGSITPKNKAPLAGRVVMQERNCTGCHARGDVQGIAMQLPDLAEERPSFAAAISAMSPPSLESVGDKLHDSALGQVITGSSKPLRPWLRIRMPRFPLSEEESKAIVSHLVEADRIPSYQQESQHQQQSQHQQDVRPLPEVKTLKLAGERLVTAAGFGCTSCHAIGKVAPHKVAPNAHGPNLSMPGERIRRSWFDRWLHDPARIVPRMEMPSVQTPVRGVLDNRILWQRAAVWEALNQPGFNPPTPGALRVVRRANTPDEKQSAVVMTDVIRIGKRPMIKPLLVALPNRHNVLFDLQRSRLAGWWIGDAARQRTEGKTWYWEPAGVDLLRSLGDESDMVLIAGGKALRPKRQGQFVTEFDLIEHIDAGIQMTHRLTFAGDDPSAPVVLARVTQTITGRPTAAKPTAAKSQSTGFLRRVQIAGLPAGSTVRLALGSKKRMARLDVRGQFVVLNGERGPCRISLKADPGRPSTSIIVSSQANDVFVRLKVNQQGTAECLLRYQTELAVDRFPTLIVSAPKLRVESLPILPGYEVTQLGLTNQIMPTALAWQGDGTLVVASLKGRVWLVRDQDGDGLEESVSLFSDELAAPYGLACHGQTIDVLNKYALLRLVDHDHDGKADRIKTLASGWGHSADYHDWAVGLAQDQAGAYYMALPCEQDKRDTDAAYLRGSGLRLLPRTPTRDDPRSYEVDPFCSGLRFPMGIAIDPRGNVFTSDNQGNYNPFNELNHWRRGAHYGFINSTLQKAPPPITVTKPAINLPHPWTRSVNGICFLRLPGAAQPKLDRKAFGPFAGHLIGCEYDTQRLMRMSLQEVDGVMQGAVYSFSATPAPGAKRLDRPICCAVAPDGDIYIGTIRDSGWGGGNNVGAIVRLERKGKLPPGIAEMRVTRAGFDIDFTSALDRRRLANKDNFILSSYRRIATPAYGGPDHDRRTEPIKNIQLSEDGRRVSITLDELREGFVYELRVRGLTAQGERFHPAEAHYTVRRRPAR